MRLNQSTRSDVMFRFIFLFIVVVFFIKAGVCSESPIMEEYFHQVEELVVTSSRLPTAFSERTRQVVIISRSEIEKAPVNNVPDLLEYTVGVDIKQRGPFGIQADASIRGATFEQTLILIDGIKVSDPQKGHHNLDLPLTIHKKYQDIGSIPMPGRMIRIGLTIPLYWEGDQLQQP
ncbi:TonB-dependent receptor [candidate division CSSED10-310 bacterium]|uniref:TonB-dependent receptor n=1 Tax=candidate division CSSED10-310 bacterium TaxID=2855610 RepID=A0ABV6YYE6_UNCC1